MSTPFDASPLLNLLESQDLDAASDIKELILENLASGKEAWLVNGLVNGLVDFYVHTQSQKSLEILAKVTEPHEKQLLDRITDHLKGQQKLQALVLLGHMVRRQSPWMHKIVQHAVLSMVIKIIKTEVDVPILMSAVLLITSLLPLIPISVAQYLHDIFDGFSRLAAFNLKKTGSVPDIYLLHLKVGIYSLFHRLYGMYPCHFLTYLRAVYSKKENAQVFEETIMPMLERVRMHPLLVTASKDKEVSRDRWKHLDVHDIIIDCAKLSLDMIEGTKEDIKCPVIGAKKSVMQAEITNYRYSSKIQEASNGDFGEIIGTEKELELKPIVDAPDPNTFFSPSLSCGLQTPPPQSGAPGSVTTPFRMTPFTPVPESPLPIDTELREKVSGSIAQKRLSGLSLSLAGLLPQTAGVTISVPPSPLKPDFTSEPPYSVNRMQAIRKIDFQQSITKASQHVMEEAIKDQQTFPVEKDLEYKLQPSVMTLKEKQNSTAILQQANIDPFSQSALQQKNSQSIDENNINNDKSQSLQQSSEKETIKHADMELKNMQSEVTKIKKDVDPSESDLEPASKHTERCSEDIEKQEFKAEVLKHDKKFASKMFSGKRQLTYNLKLDDMDKSDSEAVPKVSLNWKESPITISKKLEDQQSISVPSLIELPFFIESLDTNEHTKEEADDEVSALTGSQPDESSLSSSVCTDPSDAYLTADSVQQFMKKANRIRFNSMNVNTCECADFIERVARPNFRPNSCPEFEKDCLQDLGHDQWEHCISMKSRHDFNDGIKIKWTVESETEQTVATAVTKFSKSKSTTASQTSFVNLKEMDTKNEEQFEALETYIPYAHMFTTSIPFAPFIQCYSCNRSGTEKSELIENRKQSVSQPAAEVPFFSSLSPPELLDRHIQLGCNNHAVNLDLLTSGDKKCSNLNQSESSDEVTVLKGQLLLLHNQLLYERHKREMYAKRNRRLLGRIVKTTTLEEQTVAMKDQLLLQENEIHNYSELTKLYQTEKKQLQTIIEKLEYEKDAALRTFKQELESVKRNNKELIGEGEQHKAENKNLVKEIQITRSQLFNTKNQLEIVQKRASFAFDLQEQVTQLKKELALMGELQQKYQQRLVSVSSTQNSGAETKFLLESLKEELKSTKQILQQKTGLLAAIKYKLHEMEENLVNKENAISELKKRLESLKNLHIGQIQASEAKYQNERMIQQALQSHLLELKANIYQQEQHQPEENMADIDFDTD